MKGKQLSDMLLFFNKNVDNPYLKNHFYKNSFLKAARKLFLLQQIDYSFNRFFLR